MFVKIEEEHFPDEMKMTDFIKPLMEEVHVNGVSISKDISRIIPVERACLASDDNFQLFMKELIDRDMPPVEKDTTWCLLYKCRNNSKFFKDQFVTYLQKTIPKPYR